MTRIFVPGCPQTGNTGSGASRSRASWSGCPLKVAHYRLVKRIDIQAGLRAAVDHGFNVGSELPQVVGRQGEQQDREPHLQLRRVLSQRLTATRVEKYGHQQKHKQSGGYVQEHQRDSPAKSAPASRCRPAWRSILSWTRQRSDERQHFIKKNEAERRIDSRQPMLTFTIQPSSTAWRASEYKDSYAAENEALAFMDSVCAQGIGGGRALLHLPYFTRCRIMPVSVATQRWSGSGPASTRVVATAR
jgi:hypothetical protein